MKNKKGKFIVFEGADGCGKSTIAKMVYDRLEDMKIEVILTREPGGTKTSEKIREILLDKNNLISSETEALLMAAARAQHIKELIKPKLDSGINVLCDRFVVSSLVYQGIGRNLGINTIEKINKLAIDNTFPDLTIYFDLNYDEAQKRRNKRDISDRMEELNRAFHDKIHEGYKRIYFNYKDKYNIIRIDSGKSIEEVFDETLKEIINILEVS